MNLPGQISRTLECLGLDKALGDRAIRSYDIAELNLACAKGLPGSEELDIDSCLEQLDDWAYHVQREIERNYHRLLRSPEQFQNSQSLFCVLMMITVLQQDFGVRYNPDRIHDPDFTIAADLFLHGMMSGNGGTCASMPVLYVAVGRRLGYPMKLVHARGHVFCRWDDPEGNHPFGPARFNIEGAGFGGSSFPDEYYHRWPEMIRQEDLERGVYLKSLTPEEELASFLATRGHCLLDNGRLADARTSFAGSCHLAPTDPHYQAFLSDSQRKIDHAIEKRVLRMYYGPDVPLPYGAFSWFMLRKVEMDMYAAQGEFNTALNRVEEQRRVEILNALSRNSVNSPRIANFGLSQLPERLRSPFSAQPPVANSVGNLCTDIVSAETLTALPFADLKRAESLMLAHTTGLQTELPHLGTPTYSSRELERRRIEAAAHSRYRQPGSRIGEPLRVALQPPKKRGSVLHRDLPITKNQ